MKILFPNEVAFRGAGGKDSVLNTPESQEGIEIAPGIAGKRGNFSCSLLLSFWKLVTATAVKRAARAGQLARRVLLELGFLWLLLLFNV